MLCVISWKRINYFSVSLMVFQLHPQIWDSYWSISSRLVTMLIQQSNFTLGHFIVLYWCIQQNMNINVKFLCAYNHITFFSSSDRTFLYSHFFVELAVIIFKIYLYFSDMNFRNKTLKAYHRYDIVQCFFFISSFSSSKKK